VKRRLTPRRTTQPFALTRTWTTTAEIKAATGWNAKRAGRVLAELERRRIVEKAQRQDGQMLWRLTEQQAHR
jgi:hypothetical protein